MVISKLLFTHTEISCSRIIEFHLNWHNLLCNSPRGRRSHSGQIARSKLQVFAMRTTTIAHGWRCCQCFVYCLLCERENGKTKNIQRNNWRNTFQFLTVVHCTLFHGIRHSSSTLGLKCSCLRKFDFDA